MKKQIQGTDGLPFSVTYELGDDGNFAIVGVSGAIPEKPFGAYPNALVWQAAGRVLSDEQVKRWKARVPASRPEWAKAGHFDVLLEQVREAEHEATKGRRVQLELADGPFSRNTIDVSHGLDQPVREFARGHSEQGAVRVMQRGLDRLVVCIDPNHAEKRRMVPVRIWRKAREMAPTPYEALLISMAALQSSMDREQVERQFFRQRVRRVEAEAERGVGGEENQAEVGMDATARALRDHAEKSRLVANEPVEQHSVSSLQWQKQKLALEQERPPEYERASFEEIVPPRHGPSRPREERPNGAGLDGAEPSAAVGDLAGAKELASPQPNKGMEERGTKAKRDVGAVRLHFDDKVYVVDVEAQVVREAADRNQATDIETFHQRLMESGREDMPLNTRIAAWRTALTLYDTITEAPDPDHIHDTREVIAELERQQAALDRYAEQQTGRAAPERSDPLEMLRRDVRSFEAIQEGKWAPPSDMSEQERSRNRSRGAEMER